MPDKVVGVSFDPSEDAAPSVILKGAGPDADALLERARRENVAVVKDPQLVHQLYRVPLDTPIGRELFPVMAALLVQIMQASRQQQEVREEKQEGGAPP
jgi:type III secretion system FlhB-like substrate exporter